MTHALSRGRRSMMVLATAGAMVATACGSTVQVDGPTAIQDPAGDGLSAPAAGPSTTSPGPASDADPPESSPDGATPHGLGGTSGPGSTAADPTTTGGSGDDGRASGTTPPAASSDDAAAGIDATTIRLGVVTVNSRADEDMERLGAGGLRVGNQEANWRAIVDHLNGQGGAAGRTIELEFAFLDLASTSPQSDLQAACTRLTQDSPVFAVASDIVVEGSFVACLQRAGVPLMYTFANGLDAQAMNAATQTFFVGAPNLTMVGSLLPRGLVTSDYFEPVSLAQPTKVGLITVDLPVYERAVEQALRPGMAAIGHPIEESVAVTPVTSGDTAGLVAQLSAAVLRFNSRNITHVLFLSVNATEPLFFMQAAESQGYRPRYGLSTQSGPAGLEELVPAAQLRDARGVGWAPMSDVNGSQDPGGLPARDGCIAAIRDRGVALSTRNEQGVASSQCDAAAFFQTAADRMQAPTLTGFVQSGERLGRALDMAATFRTNFAPGRRAGPDLYRPLAYQTSCSCFTYSGPAASID